MPLSQKILLGLVPLFLLFITVSVLVQNRFQEREMLEEAQTAAHAYADIVRESLVSMMVNNLEVDSTFLDRLNTLPQFDTLRIFVNNLHLRQELLTPQRISRLEAKYRVLYPKDAVDSTVLQSGKPFYDPQGTIFRGVIPFNATTVCQKCHAVPVGYTLGATDLRVSFARVSAITDGNWKRSILIFLLFAGLMIAVATVMFRRFVSGPVYRLVEATDQISRGNLREPIPSGGKSMDPGDGDELSLLAARFDEMRASLSEKIQQLDLANRQLSDRNAALEDALHRLRLAQEELVRNERLAVSGNLLAQLSHEINNPIHNIQSLLQSSLKKLEHDEKARDLVEVALEEVARLAKLTRQMLDFYRGSPTEMEHDLVNARGLLQEASRRYEIPMREQHIQLITHLTNDVPNVRGSHDRLQQVLANLLINARDAILSSPRADSRPAGTITLLAMRQGSHLRIDVCDTGAGIAPQHINRIFDAFFTTKQEVSGVGLGLSVSHEIIRQHGGSITVQSNEGHGTTFSILLPSADEQHD